MLPIVWAQTSPAEVSEEVKAEIESIHWMVEHYPPFNYKDDADGKLKGITVDVLDRVFERVGVKTRRKDLDLLPWPRAYRVVEEKPGSMLFSMTYTPERLEAFKFVGPIIPTRVSVIAPKSRSLEIESASDLKTLRIGTIRDDIGEQLVLNLGVPEKTLSRNKSAVNLVRMLERERLDVIAYAEDIARYQFLEAGIDPNDYESVYVLKESHMGYAFRKDTSPAVLEPLQKALDELRAEGVIDSIYNLYLNQAEPTEAVEK